MIQLAIYESRTGSMIADWSGIARDVELRTDEHGYATLTAFVAMVPDVAFYWFDRPGLPWLEAHADGFTLWRGRLEDVRLVDAGIEVAAVGAWSALGDVPYTDTPFSPSTIDDIVRDMLAAAAAVNPDAFSTLTRLIEAPGVDVYDEEYIDANVRDEMTRLAALGDDQTPPRRWEIGFWEHERLYFRPRGTEAQIWYMDTGSISVERSLSRVWNSVYSRYNDDASITGTVTDTDSVLRYGVTRRMALSSQTLDTTQAERERDAVLADNATPIPRASVVVDQIRTAHGTPVPLYLVRSGDTITLRSLAPDIGTSIDLIRSFRIAETRYSCDTNTLEITPEAPLPRLDVLLARSLEVPV